MCREMLPARLLCPDMLAIPYSENSGRWIVCHRTATHQASQNRKAVIGHCVAMKIGNMPQIQRVCLKPGQELDNVVMRELQLTMNLVTRPGCRRIHRTFDSRWSFPVALRYARR